MLKENSDGGYLAEDHALRIHGVSHLRSTTGQHAYFTE